MMLGAGVKDADFIFYVSAMQVRTLPPALFLRRSLSPFANIFLSTYLAHTHRLSGVTKAQPSHMRRIASRKQLWIGE